ncbi:metal-dependent hydrolase [Chloroflexota bacterium]
MLILAHTGITLGVAVLASGVVAAKRPAPTGEGKAAGISRFSFPASLTRKALSWLASLVKFIDIRLLFVGALLPDIIDKPLGQLILRDSISNGRIFAHTLLFFIITALAGLYIYRKRQKLWLLAIAFGVLMHLVLDAMWQAPEIVLWPLYGWAFPREDLADWVPETLLALVKNPAVYIPELIGAAILIWFACFLLRRRKTLIFIKRGQID